MLLLDTNIVSFLFKLDSRANLYAPLLHQEILAIAFVTEAELYKWPQERGWGEVKRAALDRFVVFFLVLPYDRRLARTWAILMADGKRRGCVPNFADSWIAATAIRHNLPLVTHNRRHFEGIPDLTLISENLFPSEPAS